MGKFINLPICRSFNPDNIIAMKNIKKILLSLLFTLPAFAQDGFRNENGNLVWEHTYPETANMQAIVESNPKLEVDVFTNDAFTGKGNDVKTTCGGAVLMKNDCKFDFSVRKQNSTYVVTVTSLRMIERMGPMRARVIESRCEKYFVDAALKVKKDTRSKNDMNCLDNFLTGLFGGVMHAGLTAK